MYLALYRKYRPQTFSDVVGQEPITQTLKNQINENRHFHAYLFTGSRGTGKTSCAKILAKAVNCLNPQNGDPCNECEVCKAIDDGAVTDILEIDAASNNGVDNIRQLRDEANFTPVYAKYRVYIIDEVHMLSGGAFNALLKTLEEPPEHVKFILATTEIHKLPNTIISRCQRFDFKRISISDIAKRIHFVVQNEGASITDEAANLIASLADGAMRDALSILDQCISKDNKVTLDTVHEVIGLADKTKLYEVVSAVIKSDTSTALKNVEQLYKDLSDMERFCDSLIMAFRNIMLSKAVSNGGELLNLEKSEMDFYNSCAQKITLSNIIESLDIIEQSRINLKNGANRLVEMEIAVIKLCELFNDSTVKTNSDCKIEIPEKKETENLKKDDVKEQKENQIKENKEVVEKPKIKIEEIPTVENKEENSNEQEKIKKFIVCIYKKDRILSGTLDCAEIDNEDNKISIKGASPLFCHMSKEKKHLSIIKEAISEIYGKGFELCISDKDENNEKKKEEVVETEKSVDDLIDTINKAGFEL
ncbi:MAG: DNA polymerase III subunit gamma/tau [Clostridia bacterium]|nr:DNA polymerase III subunit gamma/tau [Clostridia bacterium]